MHVVTQVFGFFIIQGCFLLDSSESIASNPHSILKKDSRPIINTVTKPKRNDLKPAGILQETSMTPRKQSLLSSNNSIMTSPDKPPALIIAPPDSLSLKSSVTFEINFSDFFKNFWNRHKHYLFTKAEKRTKRNEDNTALIGIIPVREQTKDDESNQ